jgi:hypothetical protein
MLRIFFEKIAGDAIRRIWWEVMANELMKTSVLWAEPINLIAGRKWFGSKRFKIVLSCH